MTVSLRLAALFVVALGTASMTASPDVSAPQTPQQALGLLKAGNDRFVRNASSPVSLSVNRRRELGTGQHPFAMVLSCADSRVPPEFVFNVGLGDLFVIRTAGEVIDRSILATIEYGAEHLHIPLLVVMGHESCGAVKAAAETKTPPTSANLDYLLKAIQAARKPAAGDRDEVKTLVLANVEQVINDAMVKSPALQHLVDAGRLSVVGAYYELVSGRAIFSEPVSAEPAAARTAAH
jgi:carbonic anhydrase